jgi:hypothetical protein
MKKISEKHKVSEKHHCMKNTTVVWQIPATHQKSAPANARVINIGFGHIV